MTKNEPKHKKGEHADHADEEEQGQKEKETMTNNRVSSDASSHCLNIATVVDNNRVLALVKIYNQLKNAVDV